MNTLPAQVIDLSVTLSEQLPCAWPGHAPYVHKNSSWFTEIGLATGETCRSLGPYQTNFMILDEHCGTHVDGPSHFIPPAGSGLPWAGPLVLEPGDAPPEKAGPLAAPPRTGECPAVLR